GGAVADGIHTGVDAAEKDDVRDLCGREVRHQPEVDVDREVEAGVARGEDRDEATLAVLGLHGGALVERMPDRVDVPRGPVVEGGYPTAQDFYRIRVLIRLPQGVELGARGRSFDLVHGISFTRVAG